MQAIQRSTHDYFHRVEICKLVGIGRHDVSRDRERRPPVSADSECQIVVSADRQRRS